MGNEIYYPLPLPSKCRLYKDVKPEDIKIRTLKGKDEKLIAEINSDNIERKLTTVLKGVLQGIDPIKLTLGDRMHIILWEIVNSFGKDHMIEVTCDHCGKTFQQTVDFSKIESVELPDDFQEPYSIELSDKRILNVRLFRVSDEISISDFEKSGKNSWSYRFAHTIVDDNLNIVEKEALIDDLPSIDTAKIRFVQEKFQHGPDMLTEYKCSCGGNGIVAVPFHPRLLLPYGQELASCVGTTISADVLPENVNN